MRLKLIIALLATLFVGSARAAFIPVDSLQLFTNGTVGQVITDTALTNSMHGVGQWLRQPTGSPYSSWYVHSNTAVAFPSPVVLTNGESFTNTGTTWLYWTNRSGEATESMGYKVPTGESLGLQKLCVRFFARFYSTNAGSQIDTDYVNIFGNPYGALQQQASGGQLLMIGHANAGNGAYINAIPGRLYFIVLRYDLTVQTMRATFYDADNGFAPAGTSLGFLDNIGNAWWVQFQANYLVLAGLTGYTEITTPMFSWSSYDTPDLGGVIDSANMATWVPDSTVGVRGGIPGYRTNLIDVTASPYFADSTGVTNAVTAIESAFTAGSSNDVIYAPPGTYNITNGLTLNKSGLTFRGAGASTVLVGQFTVGHAASGLDTFNIVGGGNKGSTSILLDNVTDRWGIAMPTNHLFYVTSTLTRTNEQFQIISTAGYPNLFRQMIVVTNRVGSNIHFWPPLVWDFTNAGFIGMKSDFQSGEANKPIRNVGLENFRLVKSLGSLTNANGTLLYMHLVQNAWVSNCIVTNANNYCLQLDDAVNVEVRRSTFGGIGSGTSKAGITSEHATGILIHDNIFRDIASIGIIFNTGFSGNAAFGNFFTNVDNEVDCHNTHPIMNLWEANRIPLFFEMDGYFGSASHQTLFRNFIGNTVVFKRWNSYMQVVGNVVGNSAASSSKVYQREVSGYTTPQPLFEMGYPHIGNNTYEGTNPPVVFNFPGWSYTGALSEGTLTNGAFAMTNTQIATNIVWGDFSWVPAPSSGIYPIKWQVTTNRYYPDDFGEQPVFASSIGTSSNLPLTRAVTVTNGWRVFVGGVMNYNHLTQTNKYTHNLHGNLVYTNVAGTVVWNPLNLDRAPPVSLLYPDGYPSWWTSTTNRVPYVDPTNSVPVGTLPAEQRFNGTESPSSPTTTLRVGTMRANTVRIGP